jgi:hypothetical protein
MTGFLVFGGASSDHLSLMLIFLHKSKVNRSRHIIYFVGEGGWMMERISIIKFISFLLLACGVSLIGLGKPISVSDAALQAATVSVSPSSVTVPVGQNFTISVTVSGVSDLYGWEFQMGWNSTLLDAVNVSEGSFLKAGGSTFFTYTVNATAGNMIVDCTLTGSIPGVSGDGTLATITFYTKSVGECPLNLHDVTLLNSLEQPITSQTVGGYGYFTLPHDVAVTDVTASPIIVLPGTIVNVNVIVQDLGGFAEVFNVTVYANSKAIGVQTVSLDIGSSKTVTFAWNTTGLGKGDYTLLASVSLVPGEVNTGNSSKVADNIVTVLYPGHDVAVISVERVKTVVGQGYGANITATVKNYGIYNETFGTTAYVNTTAVQTQTVTLTSGNSAKLTYTWNTASFAKGNYTISAYAWPVPNETDTADNTFISGIVTVTIPGDLNGDGKVNLADLVLLAKAYDTTPGQPRWNANADIDSNGFVGLSDLVIFAKNYEKTGP